MGLFICAYCGSERNNARSLSAHQRMCPENKERIYKNGMTGKKGSNQYTKAKELGLPKPKMSHETKGKLSRANTGKKHSRETKEKISRARIKYLSENPDKIPYKLNHYSKRASYPERYWKKIFDKFDIQYAEQYQIHIYQLDFALVDAKIDIEIDGDQHYLDKRIIKSDIRRNDYLNNLGWTVIRIKWSDYKKLVNKKDRQDYVYSIIEQIRTGTQVDKGN